MLTPNERNLLRNVNELVAAFDTDTLSDVEIDVFNVCLEQLLIFPIHH